MLLLQGDIFHNILIPFDAREADGVAAGAETLYHGIAELRGATVVGKHLVVEIGILVRVGLLHHLGGGQRRERHIGRNLGLALAASLGGDKHHTVGTAHTEHGSGRSVFQHGDALYLIGVDVPHLALHTIYLNEGGGVDPCGLTTHEDTCCIAARLT